MPTTQIRTVFIVLLFSALPIYAQSSRVMNKLAEKPAEQILVFEIDRQNLANIIEATAWKMNYDSVVINSAQDKILLIRDIQKDEQSRVKRQVTLIETPWGFAFDGGATKYWYDAPSSTWLKNHYGAALALQSRYRNVVLTGRIKFWSITGKRDLPIQADTLLQRVEFSANRGEVTLGYILNFTRRLSLEPYFGYAQSEFLIFRDKEFRDKLKIPSATGFTLGAFINRELFTMTYLRCGAGFTYTDYSKINPELGRHFYTFDVSLMFRGRVRKAKTSISP